MTAMDWLIVGNLIAGFTLGLLASELSRAIAHWFKRPVKKEAEYEQAGS